MTPVGKGHTIYQGLCLNFPHAQSLSVRDYDLHVGSIIRDPARESNRICRDYES